MLQIRFLLIAFAILMASAITADAVHENPSLLNLDDYEGQVVVLDFWASWCGPCRDSFPWLNAMQDKYADAGLQIIGVNVDAERSEADAFLEKYPARFEVVFDSEGTLASHYDIQGMPSSVIIGRDGKVLSQHAGFKTKYMNKYETTLREALANTPATQSR